MLKIIDEIQYDIFRMVLERISENNVAGAAAISKDLYLELERNGVLGEEKSNVDDTPDPVKTSADKLARYYKAHPEDFKDYPRTKFIGFDAARNREMVRAAIEKSLTDLGDFDPRSLRQTRIIGGMVEEICKLIQ